MSIDFNKYRQMKQDSINQKIRNENDVREEEARNLSTIIGPIRSFINSNSFDSKINLQLEALAKKGFGYGAYVSIEVIDKDPKKTYIRFSFLSADYCDELRYSLPKNVRINQNILLKELKNIIYEKLKKDQLFPSSLIDDKNIFLGFEECSDANQWSTGITYW